MGKDIIIAIDGYVATGKGTTAQGVAQLLWYTYLDTGAMYRAVTLYALRNNLLHASEEEKQAMLKHIQLSFIPHPQTGHHDIVLNGEVVEQEIRSTQLSSQMKPIVTSPSIRQRLAQEQRRIATNGKIVVDGRDMGTVVFPDAELKLFLIGNKTIRAQRRLLQLQSQGQNPSLDDIIADITLRDNTDYLGPDAVNTQAPDALVLDTSTMTVDEQINTVYQLALKQIQGE